MLNPYSEEQTPPAILLVEDDDDDVFLMKRALRSSGVGAVLETVSDGRSAVEYLTRAAADAGATTPRLPSIVFLDLKLPYLSGFEVLTFIRNHPQLHNLPVVLLTSSSEDRDRRLAAKLAADGYLVKPPTRDMLRDAIERLRQNGRKPAKPDSASSALN